MPPMHGSSQRRSFISRLAAGTAAIGAALATGSSPLHAMTAREEFTPAHHPQDDWFDQIAGKHRIYFDAVSPTGAAEGITFASNYALANKNGYALEAADLAIVLGYRHFATPFAFSDAVWARYGPAWGKAIGYNDPVTGAPPVRNVWNVKDLPGRQPNRGVTIEMAVSRGWHFAVCDLATHVFASIAATPGGPSADDIYAELKRSTLGNAHFVAAGIVAVNRAQERRYTFSYVG